MSAPTWEQIIDAVIAGDARIGPYIAQQIVKADNAPKQPLPDMRLSSITALETPLTGGQGAIEANGVHETQTATPVSADGGVGGVVINGVDAPENDKMEWLGYQACEADALVNPNDFTPPPSALEKRLSRLGIKGVEASPHGKGGGGIKVDGLHWIEGEYDLFKSLPSAQRRTVWMALKGMNVTGDQPSCGDLELLTGVSHTTCAKVLPLYRETHGL